MRTSREIRKLKSLKRHYELAVAYLETGFGVYRFGVFYRTRYTRRKPLIDFELENYLAIIRRLDCQLALCKNRLRAMNRRRRHKSRPRVKHVRR